VSGDLVDVTATRTDLPEGRIWGVCANMLMWIASGSATSRTDSVSRASRQAGNGTLSLFDPPSARRIIPYSIFHTANGCVYDLPVMVGATFAMSVTTDIASPVPKTKRLWVNSLALSGLMIDFTTNAVG
jgi:hypothetical protein